LAAPVRLAATPFGSVGRADGAAGTQLALDPDDDV
jgi:hypothetical protein